MTGTAISREYFYFNWIRIAGVWSKGFMPPRKDISCGSQGPSHEVVGIMLQVLLVINHCRVDPLLGFQKLWNMFLETFSVAPIAFSQKAWNWLKSTVLTHDEGTCWESWTHDPPKSACHLLGVSESCHREQSAARSTSDKVSKVSDLIVSAGDLRCCFSGC